MGSNNQTDQYFEGVLQLRNPRDEVIEFIKDTVEARKAVFISKIVKVGNGFDFYLSSQRFLRTLGKMLHERFGGGLKVSSSLHTRDSQKNKDLYRINVFVKLPGFVRGDIVRVEDKVFLVKGFSKNFVSCTDVQTGKKTSLKYDDHDFEVLKKVKTSISKIHPNLEVLHPTTFDSVPVKGSKEHELDENVDVVLVGDSVVLVE
jgi:nonsense-mediated mRNA decay protein 3